METIKYFIVALKKRQIKESLIPLLLNKTTFKRISESFILLLQRMFFFVLQHKIGHLIQVSINRPQDNFLLPMYID